MEDTLVLITPMHCYAYKAHVSQKYEELGVKNARNLVGRIGNLWFRYNRIKKCLKEYEAARRDSHQHLANTVLKPKKYNTKDRPSFMRDIKRARAERDDWHYKANLFLDLDKMMASLPTLYCTEAELLAAKHKKIRKSIANYERRRKLRRMRNRHQRRRYI